MNATVLAEASAVHDTIGRLIVQANRLNAPASYLAALWRLRGRPPRRAAEAAPRRTPYPRSPANEWRPSYAWEPRCPRLSRVRRGQRLFSAADRLEAV